VISSPVLLFAYANTAATHGRGERVVDLSSAVWRKSTLSNANGCVEVAFLDGHVAVRDSKDREGPVLLFTSSAWSAFIGDVRSGKFNLSGSESR
jgi:prepilin-type processing-associated H-X9-DG protein